jgi:hypothetical protein
MKTGTEIEFKRAYNWAGDMNDTNYVVQATMYGAAVAAGDDLSITTKATSGFRITAETTSNTDYVDLAIFGVGA